MGQPGTGRPPELSDDETATPSGYSQTEQGVLPSEKVLTHAKERQVIFELGDDGVAVPS